MTKRVPSISHVVERFTLGNGLRVVISPDSSVPIVSVNLNVDVGTRSEPEGLSGFAHLFEHLVFQGSAAIPKMDFVSYVRESGGFCNASTTPDYTAFFQVIPVRALERALFLEADRISAPALTSDNIRTQVAVVEQEIIQTVRSRPLGGFPGVTLPPVLFRTFPNTHDGYGSLTDLTAATVQDAHAFHQRFYTTGNMVLSIAGDVHVDSAMCQVERHFGSIDSKPAPPPVTMKESWPTEERRSAYVDGLTSRPAVAAGWRVPDPIADLDAFLPFVVLADLLCRGKDARLTARLSKDGVDAKAFVGVADEAFEMRDPTSFIVEARLPATDAPDRVLKIISEEISRMADQGPRPDELQHAATRRALHLTAAVDPLLIRSGVMAVGELQRGDPAFFNHLLPRIAAISPPQVAAAAATLVAERRAVVEVVPGSAR
jgi:zinc protease